MFDIGLYDLFKLRDVGKMSYDRNSLIRLYERMNVLKWNWVDFEEEIR